MPTISYHERELDLNILRRLAPQGKSIKVAPNQLNLHHVDDHDELIVVATGEHSYDVLTGKPGVGVQAARLLSKIVLKKAQTNTAAPAESERVPFQHEDFQRLQNHFRPQPNRYRQRY